MSFSFIFFFIIAIILLYALIVEHPPVEDDPIVPPWYPSGYSGYLGYGSRRLPVIMRLAENERNEV